MTQHLRLIATASVCALLVLILGGPALRAQDFASEARIQLQAREFVKADSLFDIALRANPDDKDLIIDAGIAAVELERFDKAAGLFSRVYDRDRKNAKLNRYYGIAVSNLGECARAVELIRNAIQLDKGEMESYLALGNAYIMCGKDSLTPAELAFQTADKKYPKNGRIAVALGDLYFAREVYELAEIKYDEALAIDPELIEPRIRRARIYRVYARQSPTVDSAATWYRKALFEFNNVTGKAPRQPRPWLEQGEILMLAQLWEEATQSFLVYQRLRPDDIRADTLLASAAIAGSYYSQAIDPLRRILSKNDTASLRYAPRARVLLAKAYYASNKFDSAAQVYAQIPETELDKEALQLYASALFQTGRDTTRALNIYKQLIAKDPNDCQLSGALGSKLYQVGRYDEAVDVFSQRLKICPNEAPASMYYYIGLSHYRMKRYDRAAEAFQSAIRLDDTVENYYNMLMNSYALGKKYGKAGEVGPMIVAKGIDKRQPEMAASAYFYAGADRFQAKKYKEAIALFDRALRYNPNYSDAALYTAYSYQMQSDVDNACKFYKTVKRLGGENVKLADDNMKKLGCK